MLQPMHSRMSSVRPSSILLGRKGSAMEGRAAPMRSACSGLDDLHHLVGAGDAAGADHGHAARFLGFPDPGRHVVGGRGARGRDFQRELRVAADLHVPDVAQALSLVQLDEADAVFPDLEAVRPVHGVDRIAIAHRAVVADGLLGRFRDFQCKASAVFERAAVLVRPLVVVGLEELIHDHRIRDQVLDDVEARIARPDRGVDVHPDDGPDVVLVHLAGARQGNRLRRHLARCAADRAGLAALRVQAGVIELDAGERAVRVDAVGDVPQADDVAFVPETRGPVR